MKYNNVTINVDFYDPDFIEKYEEANERLQADIVGVEKIEKASEQMRTTIKLLQGFINEVFDGLSDELVGEKPKFIEIMNFYDALRQERIKQDGQMEKYQIKYSLKKLK